MTMPFFFSTLRCRSAAVLFAILCSFSPSLFAQQASNEHWQLNRQEWTLPLPSEGPVEIDNPWGDIRVRTHPKEEIYVLANYQQHQDDPRMMSLVIDNESKDKLGLQAHFAAEYPGTIPEAWQPRRIDLTVFVPEHQVLQLQTDKGLLEVRGQNAPITARTTTGAVRMRVKNAVEVYSENGAVEIFFVSTDWAKDSKIETRTSPIEVSFPRDARGKVTLSTHGQITSDFSIDIQRDENESLKTAVARLSKRKGKTLDIKSDRGPVKLLSSVISSNTEVEVD